MLKSGQPTGGLIRPRRRDWRTAYVIVAAPGSVEDGGITQSGEIAKDASGDPIADVWDEESIAEAAHSWAADGWLVSDAHFQSGSSGHAAWSESFIAPTSYTVDGVEIPAGSWVVGITPTTEEGRRMIESGDVSGVSVEGSGQREPVLAKAAPDDGDLDAELERWADELNEAQAAAVLRGLEVRERLDRIEQEIARVEPVIRARQAIAKSRTPVELATAITDYAQAIEREAIVARHQEVLGDRVAAERAADLSMAWNARSPVRSRPRWAVF